MQYVFLIVFFAAAAGVIKPYIGSLNRWQFGVATFCAFVAVAVTADVPNEDSQLDKAAALAAAARDSDDGISKTTATPDPEKRASASPASSTARGNTESDAQSQTNSKSVSSQPRGKKALSADAQRNLVYLSREGIKNRLRDAGSAKFRNVGYYSGGRAAAVCGEVNAKNAFGGFSGYERFVAVGDAAFFESDVNDGKFGVEVWDQICVKAETDEPNIP